MLSSSSSESDELYKPQTTKKVVISLIGDEKRAFMGEPSTIISLLDDCTPPPKKKAATGEPSTSLDTCEAQLYGPRRFGTPRILFPDSESESNSEEEDNSRPEQGDKDETEEGSGDDDEPESEQYSPGSVDESDDEDDLGGWEDDDGGSQYGTGGRKENADGSEDEGSGDAGGEEEIETNSGEGGGPSSRTRIGRNPESYRKYKYCPVKGCKCKQPLKKLSNHLTRQHPDLTDEQRRRCLKLAKVAPNPTKSTFKHLVIAGQPTLHSLLAPPRSPSPQPTQMRLKSTQHFLRFPMEKGTEMNKFLVFLQSKDGGTKSDEDATNTTTKVSKFLRFCGSKLEWSHLLDCDKIERFLDKVREAGCGPETERKFVMSIHHALNYVKLCRMKATDHQQHSAITVLQERLAKWRHTLNKQVAENAVQQLEESSQHAKVDLSKVNDLINCKDLWDDFDRAVESAKKRRRPADGTLANSTVALATLLAYKNMHRSGVAINATLQEYRNAREADGCKVLNVHKHKTSRQGPAKLVVEELDIPRLEGYVRTLRPLLDPTESLPELFVVPGPARLSNLSWRLKRLGDEYGLTLPTTTRIRKAGASTAASTLDAQGVRLLAKQMAHSTQTAERWYQLKDTASDSVQAFRTIQTVRSTGRVKPRAVAEEEQLQEEPSSRRMKWTAVQEEAVRDFFSASIEASQAPSINLCEVCAQSHPSLQDVPPLKIRDKVKTILRQQQRKQK